MIYLKLTLRALRDEFGLSQEQEALAIGCSPHTIGNAEAGRHAISAVMLERIANLYNISTNDITLRPRLAINRKGE